MPKHCRRCRAQDYGAAVFPMLVAWGLGIAGTLMIIMRERKPSGPAGDGDWARRPANWGRIATVGGLIVFYIVAAGPLGFMPTSVLVLVTLFMMFGSRWWVALLVACVVTLAIERGFGGLLRVPMPHGLLWF